MTPIEAIAQGGYRGNCTPHPALQRRPTELCQLASNANWSGKVPAGGIWAEPKHDGIRCLWINGELRTREGLLIHGTGHIVTALRRIERREGVRLFVDGEFVVNGAFRDTQAHFSRGARAEDDGTLWAFDAMPYEDWATRGSDTPLFSRQRLLCDVLARDAARDSWEWDEGTHGRPPPADPIRRVEGQWLASEADVWTEARAIWARGGEGLVLKDLEGGYQRKRCNDWLKVKLPGWSTRKLA